MKNYLFIFSLLISFSSFNANGGTAGLKQSDIESDLQYFTDATCTKLKRKVKQTDLILFKSELMRQVADEMLAEKYEKAYRITDYRAILSTKKQAETLKLNDGFSRYENMTGIYLNQGENIVLVGKTKGKNISLLIPDWMRQPPAGVEPTEDPNGWDLKYQEIPLHEGVNVIDVKIAGNIYINYYDDAPRKAPKIRIHFPLAAINGYFDSKKQTNEDWNRLLDNAVSPIMDARGDLIQVAYPVKWFKEFASGKGVELIKNYDKMLYSQYDLMGLVKYEEMPKNRILARVNFNYYMFRDRDGVAYLGNKSTMRMVVDPQSVIKGDPCWGFSHEAGHVMQMNPQLNWGGMGEVSNNIFALHTTTSMGNKSRIDNQNNYDSARKNIINSSPKISYLMCNDVFDRLVPFWQLQLYFSRNGKPHFYGDVMQVMREREHAGRRNESFKNMLEFVKISCDVTKTDLTDFFEQWGFFYVGKINLDDYGKYAFNITQQHVDDVKAYIAEKNYKKPKFDITTIRD